MGGGYVILNMIQETVLQCKFEMISAYGQLEVEDKENGKIMQVRPAMWVTWQSDMQVIEE